jgi:DNA-binding NarL/FixJ family response regulator
LRCGPEEWSICGEVADGGQIVTEASKLKPDVILLDLSVARASGSDIAKSLQEFAPSSTVVIMSEHEHSVLRHVARSWAVHHCLPKSRLSTDLLPQLESIARDKRAS